MKICIVALILSSVSAFVPTNVSPSRTFVQRRMSEDPLPYAPPATPSEAPVTPPAAPPAPPADPVILGGKIVPVKEETVQFTAGLVGGAAGLVIGGPVLGAIGAALANFASKREGDASEVISAVSKSSIEIYNYLSKLDAKYEVLTKVKANLEKSLDKLKANDNVNPDTLQKVEDALEKTTSKIKEVNEEYDLVGAGSTALGVVGELVEKALVKAGELNEEYKLTDKAVDAVKGAVEKAKKSI